MGGKLAQAPREAFTMLTNADLKFPTIPDSRGHDVELSESRYSLYLQSPDRALRQRPDLGRGSSARRVVQALAPDGRVLGGRSVRSRDGSR